LESYCTANTGRQTGDVVAIRCADVNVVLQAVVSQIDSAIAIALICSDIRHHKPNVAIGSWKV